MRVHHSFGPAIVLFIVAFASPASAQSWLPSNLHVEPIYRELVESMAEQSPTFRMQLARIAVERGLTIDVGVVPRVIGARARTRMVRQANGLAAYIEVARFENLVELIAHEIEHVIEQIDRVDLAAGAALSDAEIYSVSTSGTVFETARAARAGVNVSQEIRTARRD